MNKMFIVDIEKVSSSIATFHIDASTIEDAVLAAGRLAKTETFQTPKIKYNIMNAEEAINCDG